jgi:hypothetical protein
MEGRAALYDALAAGTPDAFRVAIDRLGGDPLLLYSAAWSLLFSVPDLALAERAAEEAVRATAGLSHMYREGLAAVRIRQGRAEDALAMLDPGCRLPVKRSFLSGWPEVLLAKAHLLRGETLEARHALETALENDRRIAADVRRDPDLAPFADVFRTADEEFFDRVFGAR